MRNPSRARNTARWRVGLSTQSFRSSNSVRIGVIFGGRSSEHDVSLSSARNVIEALEEAGHTVVPIGITQTGHWLTDGDPMQQLADRRSLSTGSSTAGSLPTDAVGSVGRQGKRNWGLLPQTQPDGASLEFDLIFPILHGPYGEDGTVQGLLELANLPYVGCGVLASAAAMDKVVAKQIFANEGLPQTEYRVINRARWRQDVDALLAILMRDLPFPLFVKPANLGSSVGVGKAENALALRNAINLACEYDRKVVVEQGIANAREIEVSILGNSQSIENPPQASVPGEIVPSADFYDYRAKYEDESSQLLIPADLRPDLVKYVQQMAIDAFMAIDGAGLARVDFLLDSQSSLIYLNEINTMPGFTQVSMYPKLWEASGVSYPELVDRLVQLALEEHNDRQQNRSDR